jgi:hypothetical protein
MRVDIVASSTLTTVAYDKAHQLLQLGFCSGAVYQYSGVPATVHQELLAAPSKGRCFNETIRDRFPYRLICASDAIRPSAEIPAGCGR